MNSSDKISVFGRIRNWYGKFERPISSISLIAGFVFDALTLTRVDMLWENLWVIVHLTIVTTCAIILNLIENTGEDEANPEKIHFWLVNVMQFFFGGIFSTYLVFYFRSGTIMTSWPFLVLLAAAFIANESLKRHYARLAFQLSLLFLSFYVFAIYLLPILFHQISTPVFILSGIASLLIIWLIIAILKKYSGERFAGKSKWFVYGSIALIFIAVNTLYFYNLIPPIPLSLKEAGIYQSLTVNAPGQYTVQYEDQGWFSFFEWSETIHVVPGTSLYGYTAVFSPTALDTNIVHDWQYYDPTLKKWTTRAKITLAVSGGRDGGYRTFSTINSPAAGAWRLNVETPRGQVIGQIRFDVVTSTTEPALLTKEID